MTALGQNIEVEITMKKDSTSPGLDSSKIKVIINTDSKKNETFYIINGVRKFNLQLNHHYTFTFSERKHVTKVVDFDMNGADMNKNLTCGFNVTMIPGKRRNKILRGGFQIEEESKALYFHY